MNKEQPNYPLHGITLEMIVTRLVDHYGWEKLGGKIAINCFKKDPSIKSSLKFLRTPKPQNPFMMKINIFQVIILNMERPLVMWDETLVPTGGDFGAFATQNASLLGMTVVFWTITYFTVLFWSI